MNASLKKYLNKAILFGLLEDLIHEFDLNLVFRLN